MSVVREILSLRSNLASTVSTLLALLDWQKAAQDDRHIWSRGYAVAEAVDILLLSVAAHAADALNEPLTTRTTRRSVLMARRRRRPIHLNCFSAACLRRLQPERPVC